MTVPGSGGRDSIGAPPLPTAAEQEQTAATQALKLGNGLAITKDTLLLNFFELGGQIGRYPSNPSRPVLAPLIKARESTPSEADSAASWKQAFDLLVSMLPIAVQQEFLIQMRLPIDQRSLDIVALNNVLSSSAGAVSWLSNTSAPSSTAGVTSLDHTLSVLLPFAALEGLIRFSGEIINSSTNFLDLMGANYPQQDALRGLTRQIAKAAEQLGELQNDFFQTQTVPHDQFVQLAAKLEQLNKQYLAVASGTDLTILGSTLGAMTMLSAALSLSDSCSPILYLALSLSTIGLSSRDSETGFFGNVFTNVNASLSLGLLQILSSDSNPAVQHLLSMGVSALFIGAVTVALLTDSIGYIPQTEQARIEADRQNEDVIDSERQEAANVDAARHFSQELSMLLMERSGVVDSTIGALVETFGLNKVQSQQMHASLKLMALTTMILATLPAGNPQNAALLFGNMQSTYTQSLQTVTGWLDESLMDGSINGEAMVSLNASLQEAQSALREGDIENFINSLMAPLGLAGASSDQAMADLGAIRGYVQLMTQSLTTGVNDLTNTQTTINFVA